MLKESPSTRQFANEPARKWFHGDGLDLIVWYGQDEAIVGFQLCYNKGLNEHALTWWQGRGFSHTRIDDGEGFPDNHKMTPILLPDGTFDKAEVIAAFRRESKAVDSELVSFIIETVNSYRP